MSDSPPGPYLTIVPQRHTMDCAVCCLAMLLELSYEDVLLAFKTNVYRTGATTRQMLNVAKRLGKPLRFSRAVDPEALESSHGILLIAPEGKVQHTVLLREGTIVDTDATLWDADVYLATYKARPLSLLILRD